MLTNVISKIKQFILKIKKTIFEPRNNNDVQNLDDPEISTKNKVTQEQDTSSIHKDEEPASSKSIKQILQHYLTMGLVQLLNIVR
ncbi:hypothetical protein [Limosilactobacillus reuteri]|uniref:hypothetical protein n=1 Tax=Limosilactobacillus reuteri TaxID=1598 RepID=UPI001CDA7DB0|nr:hypothetical protein [Limosilactobacillus reuteri]